MYDVAVFFDGAGLARKGLEDAGFSTIGVEIDPVAHHLSKFLCKGPSILMSCTDVFSFKDRPPTLVGEVIKAKYAWFSPPCQSHSYANRTAVTTAYGDDLLQWSFQNCTRYTHYFIENVEGARSSYEASGLPYKKYNAHQFTEEPLQIRSRFIAHNLNIEPHTYRTYSRKLPGICPTITATEFRGHAVDQRRASRFYGRMLTLDECAYHMGMTIPAEWYDIPKWWPELQKEVEAERAGKTLTYYYKNSDKAWTSALYKAIGNGVPVYMAKAFGEALKQEISK